MIVKHFKTICSLIACLLAMLMIFTACVNDGPEEDPTTTDSSTDTIDDGTDTTDDGTDTTDDGTDTTDDGTDTTDDGTDTDDNPDPKPDPEVSVVYLGGIGALDSNHGKTESAAVATLEKAYELLDEKGGTIILCGNIAIKSTDGSSTPFGSKDAHIKGNTGLEKLIVKGAKGSATLVIQNKTEISNLTLDWVVSDDTGLYIFSGPSLTIGENMVFTKSDELLANLSNGYTKDHISIRMGAFSDKTCTSATYVQKSGALSSVYAGNNKVCPATSSIHITDAADVLVRLQGGATSGNSQSTEIKIDGDNYIGSLNFGGHGDGFSVGSTKVHITSGKIVTVTAARTAGFKVGDVEMRIGGRAKVEALDWDKGVKTGTSYRLIFEKGYREDRIFESFGDFWTEIKLEENVKLRLTGTFNKTLYPLVKVADGAVLYLGEASNTTAPVKGTDYIADGTAQTGKVEIETHTGHTHTHYPATCGTSTQQGNIEYWHCTENDTYYADEACTDLISESEIFSSDPHSLVLASPTCDEYKGNAVCYICTVCGDAFADSEGKTAGDLAAYKLATAHVLTKVPKSDPTCTEDGVRYEHYHCSACNRNYKDENGTEVFTFSIIEPKTGHELELVEGEIYRCPKCGKKFQKKGVLLIEIPE